MSPALVNEFFAGELMHTESIAFTNHLRNLGKLLRHNFGHFDLRLQIIVVLLETCQQFHVLGVVWEIVVDIHRCQLIEALDEHSLTVGIDKA